MAGPAGPPTGVTDISKSFTHKMAAKTSWHRYGANYVIVTLCIYSQSTTELHSTNEIYDYAHTITRQKLHTKNCNQ